jgi:hypothetical protein
LPYRDRLSPAAEKKDNAFTNEEEGHQPGIARGLPSLTVRLTPRITTAIHLDMPRNQDQTLPNFFSFCVRPTTPPLFNLGRSTLIASNWRSNQKGEEIMQPTAWEIRNRLAAILNFARQSGKSYVDVESNSLQKQVADASSSDRSMSVCWDVMKKLMRPGDSILQESPIGRGTPLAIRYMV